MTDTRFHAGAVTRLVIVAAIVLVLDQALKAIALVTLTEGVATPFVGEALQLLLVRNSGAAFSLIANGTLFLTFVAVVAVAVILWKVRTVQSRAWAIMMGLLLGGVLGNLLDRLLRPPAFAEGHVIDYLYTPWLLPAVYNLADIAILSAAVLMVVLVLRGVPFAAAPESIAPTSDTTQPMTDSPRGSK